MVLILVACGQVERVERLVDGEGLKEDLSETVLQGEWVKVLGEGQDGRCFLLEDPESVVGLEGTDLVALVEGLLVVVLESLDKRVYLCLFYLVLG